MLLEIGLKFKHLDNPGQIIETIILTMIGLIIFGMAIWIMEKVTPFSIRKEIEDDQNVALGIIIGSVIIGIAIVLAAVMSSK